MTELLDGVLATLAYGAVGTALMALGFALVDLATPGKLRDLIWAQGNRNAAILLASGLLGVGVIADPQPHPAAWVSGAVHLSISAMIAGAVS